MPREHRLEPGDPVEPLAGLAIGMDLRCGPSAALTVANTARASGSGTLPTRCT
jgi:hypothetical protein